MNDGQIIVDYLIQEKVSRAFGLCGHGKISFIEANIQGDVNPSGAGACELPGLGHGGPASGKRTIIKA